MSPRGIPSYRVPYMATDHAVSSAHYLATAAGHRILEEGGNAIDAGVATGIAINTTLPHLTSFSGVAAVILYLADRDEVVTISGVGRWPRGITLEGHIRRYGEDIPYGMGCAVVSAAADAWLTALELYGTMTFEQAVAPSLELAEHGFPAPPSMPHWVQRNLDVFQRWPANRDLLLPNGRVRQAGEPVVQRELAGLFRRMIEVERASAFRGRRAAIRAVRDYFYKGDVAEAIVRYCQEQGGQLTREDFRDFSVKVEPPQRGTYKDVTLYTCGFWCQGPSLIQILNLLERYDLQALAHNSANYIHALIEAIKLAFADRHNYYGDPEFVDVPAGGLLSKEYAAARRELIDIERAWPEMPPPGDPRTCQGVARSPLPVHAAEAERRATEGDTAYLCAVDRWGNAFGATTSDSCANAPLVPGLGIIVSPRGRQTWLDPSHPSCLAPWKRPRLTPNPALAFRDGRLFLAFGTPGTDVQVQAMVQMFLNMVEFGMDTQQAIEEPRAASYSFPGSFWPHPYYPGLVRVEGRVPQEVMTELARRGHQVESWEEFAFLAGCLCGISVDHQRGLLIAGADPRREAYAMGR